MSNVKKCSGCSIELDETFFDMKGNGRRHGKCSQCRSEVYLSAKYKEICKHCNLPQKVNSDNVCSKCNLKRRS